MYAMLLGYYLAFFGAAFVLPTVRLWSRSRINGLVLPAGDSAHALVGRWFKGLIAAVLAILAALASGADFQAFGPLNWALHIGIFWMGCVLLTLSALIIIVAQSQMGMSWRIGIDDATHPPLITHGLFAKSRNPIFLGMRINMIGLVLILPCAATLTVMMLSEVLIAIQVRLEEEHLGHEIGEAYRRYTSATPRWI